MLLSPCPLFIVVAHITGNLFFFNSVVLYKLQAIILPKAMKYHLELCQVLGMQ